MTETLQETGVDVSDLDSVYRHFSKYVAHLAMRMLGRSMDVDDVVQDVFMDAMHGLKKLRDPAAIGGWLKVVTVRKVHRRLQKRRLRQFFSLDEQDDYSAVTKTNANQHHRAVVKELYQALDKLPADERLTWSLHYIEGEKIEAIATLTSCSERTVKRRLAAARTHLEGVFGASQP